jgi:hypothetical protein
MDWGFQFPFWRAGMPCPSKVLVEMGQKRYSVRYDPQASGRLRAPSTAVTHHPLPHPGGV